MKLFLAFLFTLSVAFADTQIGVESLKEFPRDASFSGMIYTRPASNTTQYANPPMLSWSPKVNPFSEESGSLVVNAFHPEFQLIISTNLDLSNPIINRRVIANMEIRLYPFTNANGTIKSNTIYWSAGRVATNGLTNGWIPTNWFVVHASATNWSGRGLLADETYLAASTHPYILFHPTNRVSAYQFFQTNDTHGWSTHLLHLDQFTNHATSGNTWPTNLAGWSTNGNWGAPPGGMVYPTNHNVNFTALWAAIFHYGLTNDANIRTLTINQYSNCVNWILGVHYVMNDIGNGDQPTVFNILSYGFDWLYNDLDATTRANAILAGERYAKWTMRQLAWGGASWVDGYDTNFVLNSMQQMWFAMSEEGTSHGNIQFQLATRCALAFYPHGTNARAMFDAGINWAVARGNFTAGWAAINQGRGYATVGNPLLAEIMIDYNSTFPETELWKAPPLQGFATWLFDMVPPGWREYHGAWGDGGFLGALATATTVPQSGQLFAWGSRNGDVIRAYSNSLVFYNPTGLGEPILQQQLHALWPPVAATTNYTGRAYLEDGFVIGATKPLNNADAFTNGLIYILAGRPRAKLGGESHESWCDGDVEFSAYGAKFTDSGAVNLNPFGYLPESHTQMKFSGAGNRTQYFYGDNPLMTYYSYVRANTNNDAFSYSCVDTTLSYSNRYELQCGTNVLLARRHVLLRKAAKYLIVFDEGQTWTNSVFSVNMPILLPGVTNFTANSYRFGSTNFAGQTISNHVFQIVSGYTITNMTGTNVTRNPVTGEYVNDLAGLWSNHVHFVSAPTTQKTSLQVWAPQYPGSNAPVVTVLGDNSFTIEFNGVTETVTASGDAPFFTIADGGGGGGGSSTNITTVLSGAAVISGGVRLQ